MHTENSFKNVTRKRQRRRLFDNEGEDESLEDPKEKFRVEFYYAVLAVVIQQLDERFIQLHDHSELFGFLYNLLKRDRCQVRN